jgi:spermidine/putrescine transport system substrate-binding protein
MVSESIGYATPNKAALQLLPKGIRANRVVYPTPEELKGSEFQTDVGDAIGVYEKYWEMLKVGR